MRISTITASVLTLALGMSAGINRASGQAMVSYGHGVAKAAGAGAAVGAGVGGALTGLDNPLSRAAEARGPAAANRASVRRQQVPQRRENIRWDLGPQGFGAPAPLGLVGGVQATGVGSPSWQPTLLAPSENIAVLSEHWGGGEEFADTAGKQTAGEATAEAAPLEASEEPAKAKLPVVIRSSGWSQAGSTQRGSSEASKDEPAIPEGIEIGVPFEKLVEKLGRPHLAFRGVAGVGYSDQYVFKLPDGTDLVVYVLNGVVSQLAVT